MLLRAKNDDNLGAMFRTDMCCRTHDKCPESIEEGKVKFGLKNEESFTMSRCDCDMQFRKCSSEVHSDYKAEEEEESLQSKRDTLTARNIRKIRWSEKCFLNEHPWTCLRNDNKFKEDGDIRCRVYKLDKTQPKSYRFFELPLHVNDGGRGMNTMHGRDFIELDPSAFTLDDLL